MDDVLPVVVTTNGKRRRLCLFVLNTLLDNLKYDGDLFFVIACDRCYADVCSELEGMFESSGFGGRYLLVHGTDWADALNCAIRAALERSDCLFRTEDDYVLTKTLDVTEYVDAIMSKRDCGIIKFKGALASHARTASGIAGLTYIGKGRGRYSAYTATMYPSLMHRRTFDAIGFYRLPHIESNFCHRFNMHKDLKVAAFVDMPGNISSDKLWFAHAGRSTLHHRFPCSKKYDYLNEKFNH